MSERERLEHHPRRPSVVNKLARELNEIDGPGWTGWHYGAIPGLDAALFAKFLENENGRMVLAGVMLLGDAITADQLRKVPIAALENSRNLSHKGVESYSKMRAELEKLRPLMRGDSASEDFSRLVAEHFRIWARHVPNPAAAMAAEWKVKPPTMHTWIREARLRGFLPPASRGKAGPR